ncbi:hypothetical protein SKPI104516_18685 [Skermania piniformis]
MVQVDGVEQVEFAFDPDRAGQTHGAGVDLHLPGIGIQLLLRGLGVGEDAGFVDQPVQLRP